MKKVCIIILSAMFLSAAYGCGNSADDLDGNATASTISSDVSTSDEQTTRPLAVPDLPEKQFDGYKFTIFARGPEYGWQVMNNIDTEEQNGEPLNDALYRRNKNIEEQYNIEIVGIPSDKTNGTGEAISALIMAGDDVYDAIILAMNQYRKLVMGGTIVDLKEIPYIGWEKPWWDQNLQRDLSIDGKLYGIMGDICVSTTKATRILMFDKQVLEDYKLEDPYELVHNGKWTLDKFNEMCKCVTNDINGDSVMDENDLYGFLVQKTATINMFFSAGENMIKKNADDIPEQVISGNQRAVDVLTKMLDIFTSHDSVYVGEDAVLKEMFRNNRGLFFAEVMGLVEGFRNDEINFGILPVPKFDENQEEYYHFADSNCMSLLVVPKTNTNFERTGIILEALAAESDNTIVPAFYDINLIGKFFRDDESTEMLDLILGTRVISLDEVFGWGMHSAIRKMLDNFSYDIASTIETNINIMISNINATMKVIENN